MVFLAVLLATQGLQAQLPPKPRDTTITGPQTFAMIMGISKYLKVRPLEFADKDAEMFMDFLKSPAGGNLPADNVFCLLNDKGSNANFMVAGFAKWLKAKKLQKGDRLFIYLAGHGDAIDETQYYYLTYDCNPAGDKANYQVSGAMSMYDLKANIARQTNKGIEVYLIMDACRTNELPGGKEGQSYLATAVTDLNSGESIMMAAEAGQESMEHGSIGSGHGLFTYYLIDGLAGMADASKDNKITFKELQQYVAKKVPEVASQYKRKQDPYFCCPAHSENVLGVVDTSFLRKWLEEQKLQSKKAGSSASGKKVRKQRFEPALADTTDPALLSIYNQFNNAVRENRLTGDGSAENYCNQLMSRYPGNSYTSDAQTTLAVEFVNFAQSKINMYLDCKDVSSVQRLRAQLDEEEQTDEIASSLNRMEKVAQKEFYEIGDMLEKAIRYIREDDPDFANTLLGRMYFFKARGYFSKSQKQVDRNTAFEYAYAAYRSDKSAPYILNTLSSLHLDNNRLDSAIVYAQRAIVSAPRWRYPYVTLAYAYKTLNKPDSAIKYYRKSIEVSPDNADAYVDLGQYFNALSNTDSAVHYYEKALQLEPNNPVAANNIGWVNFTRKNYEQAIRFFKSSIQYNPRLISAYNGLSKAFMKTKQVDSARIYYAKAFANYQDKSFVNNYIGNFFRDQDELDSAKVYYRMAAALDPGYEEAFNNLGKINFIQKHLDSAQFYYRRALQANPFSAAALINIGMVFKEMKLPDSTYNYFQQAVRLEPGNPAILNNLGAVFGEEKKWDSAKTYFKRALFIKPDYKPASNNLIKIFKDLGQPDSITQFIRVTSLFDRNSTPFFNNLGLAFLDQKRYDSAGWYFRKALEKDPANPQFLSNLGLVFQGMKKYDSARVNMQKALGIDPDNPIVLTNLVTVFKQLKAYDSAAWYFKTQALRKGGSGAPAWFALGNFFDEMKEYDSAVVYYRKAIEADPAFIPPYLESGNVYMKIEQNDSAIHYYSKTIALDSTSATAQLNLGLLYHSSRRYDLAIAHLQKAIRLDPAKPKNLYSLACSFAMANKPEQAVFYLGQAYERGYKNKENLVSDPDLSGLKERKDFQALLDKYVPDWRNR